MKRIFEFLSKSALRQFIGAMIFGVGGCIVVAALCSIIKMLIL
jgi:hypothetical protein